MKSWTLLFIILFIKARNVRNENVMISLYDVKKNIIFFSGETNLFCFKGSFKRNLKKN